MLIKPAFLSKLWQEQIPADHPLGVSARNLPPGKDMLPLLHLVHAYQRLPELVIGPGNPACSLCGTYHRYLPYSQTSPRLPCFHLCVIRVIPVWPASHPSLCLCLFCWDISFTYIPHSKEKLIHETQRSTQLLDHSLSGKGKELVLMSYLTCVQLSAFSSLSLSHLCISYIARIVWNGCNTVHIKDKKTEAHKGQIT